MRSRPGLTGIDRDTGTTGHRKRLGHREPSDLARRFSLAIRGKAETESEETQEPSARSAISRAEPEEDKARETG